MSDDEDQHDADPPRHPTYPNRLSIFGLPVDMLVSTMPQLIFVAVGVLILFLLPVIQVIKESLR